MTKEEAKALYWEWERTHDRNGVYDFVDWLSMQGYKIESFLTDEDEEKQRHVLKKYVYDKQKDDGERNARDQY